MIIWFTGLPGAGKSTLMRYLRDDFVKLDADIVREIHPEPFTEEGRRRNVKRIQEMAVLLDAHCHDVAVACIAPYRDQREAFKAKYEVMEVYLPGGHWDESYGPNIYEPPE